MDILEKVEAYYAKEHRFKKEIRILRKLALKSGAQETYKWSAPVYTSGGKNIFWIARFKNHCGLGFFNGMFLTDSNKKLVNAQEGKTQAMRHWKFTSGSEIDENMVLDYIHEAIENQKKGKVFIPNKKKPVKTMIPLVLQEAFDSDSKLKETFEKLSPYKQRDYIEYIATAKQEKTKRSRLVKIIPMISEGKGLNDAYK